MVALSELTHDGLSQPPAAGQQRVGTKCTAGNYRRSGASGLVATWSRAEGCFSSQELALLPWTEGVPSSQLAALPTADTWTAAYSCNIGFGQRILLYPFAVKSYQILFYSYYVNFSLCVFHDRSCLQACKRVPLL